MKFKVARRKDLTDEDIKTFDVKKNGEVVYSCKLQEPDFESLALAMSEMTTTTGKMNIANAGRVLFNTCCIELDEALEKDNKALLSLCLNIANHYLADADYEIEKK
jgi:hypothetical protein